MYKEACNEKGGHALTCRLINDCAIEREGFGIIARATRRRSPGLSQAVGQLA